MFNKGLKKKEKEDIRLEAMTELHKEYSRYFREKDFEIRRLELKNQDLSKRLSFYDKEEYFKQKEKYKKEMDRIILGTPQLNYQTIHGKKFVVLSVKEIDSYIILNSVSNLSFQVDKNILELSDIKMHSTRKLAEKTIRIIDIMSNMKKLENNWKNVK